MKVTAARYELNLRLGNAPELHVEVDSELDERTLKFRFVEPGFYVASHEDWCCGYFHNGKPEKQSGFGGRPFQLNMEDGTEKTLYGPWNTNIGSAFPDSHLLNVTIYPKGFGKGGYFGWYLSGWSLIEAMKLADKSLPDPFKSFTSTLVLMEDGYSSIMLGKCGWMTPRIIRVNEAASSPLGK